MRVHLFIEKYFWIFLLGGIILGLAFPVYNDFLMSLLKPFLMLMLFLVFLKTDIQHIFQSMKNYRLMSFIVIINMAIIPVIFFFIVNIFDSSLALAILLLTAMPAGVTTPALTDIVKGNTALSASIVIATSVIAPLTVPLLFWIIGNNDLSVSPWLLFKDLASIVFLPMIISQIVKKYFPKIIEKNSHLFTSVNIIVLAVMVYAVMGSERDVMLGESKSVLWKLGFLYLVFILLHVFGFITGYREDKEGKVAITIGSAYINNGMAIVLAALYFEPSILFLMILSELPWNTLLIPFKKVVRYL
jgi:bile acid:Na+ symporter, BASS family